MHESPRLSAFSAEPEHLCTRPSIAGYNGKAIAPRLERFIHDIARAASAYAQAFEAHDRPAYRVRACDRRGLLNTKVRNADEIEDLLGLPVIGRMPALKGGK